MNIDLLFAIIFYGLLLIFFFKYREKFEVQGKIFALYRTKLGLKLMDTFSKFSPRLLKFIGVVGVIIGFGGMLFIFYWLIKGTIRFLFVPEAVPAVAPVLPGVKIPGLPMLSFWHWIVAIFIVAVVHEFCHGIYARLYQTKIKSSGFAFLGPILAAFVEPDEKQLAKKSKTAQLSVLSAGPFSNIVLGLIFLLVMNTITGPIYLKIYEPDGIKINEITKDYPAEKSGLIAPFVIKSINGQKTLDSQSFFNTTSEIKPGQKIILETDKGNYNIETVENPKNKSKGFIGISNFDIQTKIKDNIMLKYGSIWPKIFSWFHLLVFWLVIVNIGVGLFNLLPLGPVDGGRMFYLGLQSIFKNLDRAKKVWTFITLICLLLIFVNLSPYLWKLIQFLIKPFTLFLS